MDFEPLRLSIRTVLLNGVLRLSFLGILAAGPSYAAEPAAKAPQAKSSPPNKAAKEPKTKTAGAKSTKTPAVDISAGPSLAKANACLTCHGIDKKIIGPGFKEIALRYKGDGNAPARLMEKVKAGGGGVWGTVPMPPNPQVSADDVKTLVHWVLAQ